MTSSCGDVSALTSEMYALQEGIALLVSKDGYNIAKNLLTEVDGTTLNIQFAPSTYFDHAMKI